MAEMFRVPNVHSFLSDVEANAKLSDFTPWMQDHHYIPIVAVLLYVFVTWFGQAVMEDEKPMQLKLPLILWNSSLALFSICCVLRILPPIVSQLQHMSLEEKICSSATDGPTFFWVFLFTMSKFMELGDTVFLILRKRPVIFLHWYHHTTVLLFTWFAFAEYSPILSIFACVNAFIHSLMYTYYALQAIGVKCPKSVSLTLTSLQIIQMVAGLSALFLHWNAERKGHHCQTSSVIWLAGVVMYASYFLLFVRFFANAYLFKRETRDLDENRNRVKGK